MKLTTQIRALWRAATAPPEKLEAAAGDRKTLALPAILTPVQYPGRLLPKPTPLNLRRFEETI